VRAAVRKGKPAAALAAMTASLVAVAVVTFGAAALAQGAPPAGPGIARAAQTQVGVTLTYDPSYRRLAFPGGDVPLDRGVCSDVVVRAFRAVGVDLQVRVHEDMKAHFAAYPQLWGTRGPDANIDHRRVPNLMRFFERQGKAVARDGDYLPGDVVAWRLANGLLHVGVVAEGKVTGGEHPYVVHNIGQGARREDVLDAFEVIGHYRW
jgi:uncharacterized protein YijF (DUF1287 family)